MSNVIVNHTKKKLKIVYVLHADGRGLFIYFSENEMKKDVLLQCNRLTAAFTIM